MSGEQGPKGSEQRRRRKLRAALILLRRRIIEICNEAASVTSIYDEIKNTLGPIIGEFADVLPAETRERLERLMNMAQERREDLETACKICKGELLQAIKDIASRMGIEGRIRRAIWPIEQHFSRQLLESVVPSIVAAAIALAVSGFVAFKIIAACMPDDDNGDNHAVATATAEPTETAEATATVVTPENTETPTPTETAKAEVVLPNACGLITIDEAQEFAQLYTEADLVQGGEPPVCVYYSPDDPAGTTGCPRVTVSIKEAQGDFEPETGAEPEDAVGEEAYYSQSTNNLIVLQGEFVIAVSAHLEPAPCDADQVEIDSWHDQWVELAKMALSRLPD